MADNVQFMVNLQVIAEGIGPEEALAQAKSGNGVLVSFNVNPRPQAAQPARLQGTGSIQPALAAIPPIRAG